MRRSFAVLWVIWLIGCAPTSEPIIEATLPAETQAVTDTPAPTDIKATATQTETLTAHPPIASWCPLPDDPLLPSADVLRMAYIKDGMIWMWDHERGDPVQITSEGDAYSLFLSDDGQVIAFLRGESRMTAELWAINADGSNPRLLVGVDEFKRIRYGKPEAPGYYARMQWIPGTHQIAYNAWSYFGIHGGIYNVDPDDLHIVDADTLISHQILVDGEGGPFTISPNGLTIAAMGYDYITLVKPDGTNKWLDVLDAFTAQGAGEVMMFPSAAWTTDSQRLVLAIPTKSGITYHDADRGRVWEQDTNEVWSLPLDASAPEQIGTYMGSMYGFRFSRDAEWLAYQDDDPAFDAADNIDRLHVVNLTSGEDAVMLSMQYLEFIGWSPDARHYIYRAGNFGEPMLGDICGGSQALMQFPLEVREDQHAYYHWIDPERYLISVNNYYDYDDFGLIIKVDYHLGYVDNGASMLVEGTDSFDYVLLPDD